jgi:hypothetical protein
MNHPVSYSPFARPALSPRVALQAAPRAATGIAAGIAAGTAAGIAAAAVPPAAPANPTGSLHAAGLLTQWVPGVPQDPFAPRQGPLAPSPYRKSSIGKAPALVPGPAARL